MEALFAAIHQNFRHPAPKLARRSHHDIWWIALGFGYTDAMKISITEARRRVPEVIGAAIAGQDVIITRRGKTDHVFRAGEEIITVRRVDPAQTRAAMRAIRRALKSRRHRPALETALEGLHAERQRRGG